MKNKISIIIPVYKVEKFLNRCVDSIITNAKEHIKDLEIILANDGSPDNSPKICDEYAEKYNFVKVIHKENGGVSSARNAGMEIATGEYITFADSDDYVNEDFYKMFDVVRENQDVEVFQFEGLLNKKVIKKVKTEKLDLNYKNNLTKIFKSNYENCWTKVIKTELIKNNEIIFPSGKKSEDLAFSTKVIVSSKNYMLVDIAYYEYSLNENYSVTLSHSFEKFRDQTINNEIGYNLVNNLDINPKLKKVLLRQVCRMMVGNIAKISLMKKEEQKESIKFISNFRHIILKPFKIETTLLFYIYKFFGLKTLIILTRSYFKSRFYKGG